MNIKSSDIKSILQTAYPFIGTALSVGGLPGQMAANILGKVLNVDKPIEPTIAAAQAAIATATAVDPEVLSKLTQVENDFKLQMTQMGIDSVEKLLQLDNSDRADARAREIAVKDPTPQRLAYADGLIFLGAFIAVLIVPVPQLVHDLVLIMITTMANNVVSERSYYFGSSAGSKAHGEVLATIAANGEQARDDRDAAKDK
jgi:hypothetical protein